MAKRIKKRSVKSGLPPGTLVHIGENKTTNIKITVVDYSENNCSKDISESLDTVLKKPNTEGIRWINLDGIQDTYVMEQIGKVYNLHPLVLEDILNTSQRPKMEDYGDYIYIVAKLIGEDSMLRDITTEQLSIILGKNYVITFQEDKENIFEPVVDRIAKGLGTIRKMGADYLVYSILDFIVDSYFLNLEKSAEKIEVAEDSIMLGNDVYTPKEIQKLRSEIMYMHRVVWPLREVVNNLKKQESPIIKDNTVIYLRDVYDHTVQIIDTIETYRDILSGVMDLYLSSTSNRMNETMKFLAIFSAVLLPITFIAGVYGMNFDHMPELRWKLGYPYVLGIMGLSVIITLLYFKKKKWI